MTQRERRIEAVRRVLMDVVADGDAAICDLSEWAADVLDAVERADLDFAGTRLGEAEADRVVPASAGKAGADDWAGPCSGDARKLAEYIIGESDLRRLDAEGGAWYALELVEILASAEDNGWKLAPPEDSTDPMPADLVAALRDPSLIVPQDAAVWQMLAAWRDAPSSTASAE